MLLDNEKKRELAGELVARAREVLAASGEECTDRMTGLVTRECRIGPFLLIEHQRQVLEGGEILTNGLDIWHLLETGARKRVMVRYVPFEIKVFDTSGRAEWIALFDQLTMKLS